MANAWNRKDLQVNYKYDLVCRKNTQGTVEILKTGNASPAHTLAQTLYLVVQSSLGEFALRSTFGANPKVFHGKKISQNLINEIESFVKNSIKRAGVNDDGFPLVVKAVPITRNQIAMQVKVTHPRDVNQSLVLIRMLYSTSDNTVSPLYNGHGS